MCVHGRKDCEIPMLRCCLCVQWFHLECVGLMEDDANGVWSCPFCRTLGKDITSVKDSQKDMLSLIKNMSDQINALTRMLNTVHKNSQTLLEDKNRECINLREANAGLRERISQLTAQQSKNKWNEFTRKSALLIGDFTIKDIDETKLVDTEVLCIAEGRINDVTDALKSKVGPYRQVLLCVGSNDCSDCATDNEELLTLIPKYEEAIKVAACITAKPEDVIVSSLLPRCDDDKVSSVVNDFNEDLSTMAHVKHVSFVNNDPDFKLLSGKANDAMLTNDGLNLTYKGTRQLAKNLHLDFGDNVENRKSANYTTGPRGRPHPNQCSHRRPPPSQGSYRRPPPSQGSHRSSDSGSRWPPTNHSTRHRHVPQERNRDGSGNYRTPLPSVKPPQRGSCEYCGKRNHATGTCRHGQPLRCHSCNYEGHKSKFCSLVSDC